MLSFRPNVGNQDGLAVTTDGILKQVSQLALAVRHVVSLGVTGRHYNLF